MSNKEITDKLIAIEQDHADRGWNAARQQEARAKRAERRVAELEEEAAELIRFKEVMKSAVGALKEGKPLNLESLFKGELVSSMFAMMFAGEFKRSGAKNYLELLYEVPEFGELTVTIQKVDGKTPAQRIAELEALTEEQDQRLMDYAAIATKNAAAASKSRALTVKLPIAATDGGSGYKLKAVWAIKEACANAGIDLKFEE